MVERLDEVEAHAIGERDQVVVAFDGGSLAARLACAGFDDVGVDGALGKVLHGLPIGFQLLGDREELLPELRSDDAALLLRLGHAGQELGVAVLGVHMDEVDVELLGEDFLDLLGLALAQQAVVNEHAGHLLADGAGAKGGDHGGVHTAGKRQDDAVLTDLLAELGGHGLDEVVHRPVLFELADVEEEVGEDLLAEFGVLNLGVELRGVDALLGVLHRGHRAYVGRCHHGEALGHVAHGVEVAHPHGLLGRGALEKRAALNVKRRGAVFAHLGVEHGTAERHRRDLMPIAKAEHRHAQLVDRRVDARGVFGVHARRASRQDDGGRRHLAYLLGGDVARHDLRVHMKVAHAAGNQLPVLRPEVEHEDFLG